MPKIGHFVLHSNFMPQITAGRYQLRSEQTGLPFDVASEVTHLHVASPRFTMPTDQILSTFPPANAEGAFGDRLPQIVLKRRTLPWERNPAGGAEPSDTPWLALVVVAEGEAELSSATPVADCVTPGTGLREPADKDVEQGLYLAVTETVVRKIFPTKDDLPLLCHVREVDVNDTELANGDDDGWLSVVLANRLPVFDTAGAKPVRYMACLVNVEGQLDALPPKTPAVDRFAWSLAQDWSVLAQVASVSGADATVLGHGATQGLVLPQPMAPGAPAAAAPTAAEASAGRAAAAAPRPASGSFGQAMAGGALDGARAMTQAPVSRQWAQTTQQVAAAAMDPDAVRLVRDTMGRGFRYPIGRYAVEKVLRFPVLAHWSFTTSEGATFETLMQDLDVGLLGTLPPPPKSQRAGVEAPPSQPDTLPEVMASGHLGLAHRARRGDAVRAWYRGPCVPFPAARDGAGGSEPLPLAHAADQLRRVVPDGREDLSLASAFEIGRLLALSQLSVVSALLRFRAEQFGAGRVRELMARLVPFPLPALAANAGPKRVDLGRFVAVQMIDALARNTERMLGPQRPVADPGREIKVDGDIDRLIASGLGLDHGALIKRSQEVGMLAALDATAVPVAGTLGDTRVGKRELQTLQGALAAELARTLDVALPAAGRVAPTVTTGPALRRGRSAPRAAAATTRDALDDLIDRARDDAEAVGPDGTGDDSDSDHSDHSDEETPR